MVAAPLARGPRAAGAWLAAGVALVCFLTAGGSMTTTDAVVAFDVTRNLVERHSVATSGNLLGNDAYRGLDGRYYSPFGIAQSVWNIPFYLAGRAGASRVSVGSADTLPKAAVALATVPAVALLAWTAFELLLLLGAEARRAYAIVLLLVFGTPLWPYSGFGFNQPLTAWFLWTAACAALAAVRGRPRVAIAAGLFAGLAVLTRHEMVLAAVILALYFALTRSPARLAALGGYAIGLVAPAVAWGALNWWRFGNPLNPGYLRDTTPGYGHSIVAGGAGLLFSPYASLFLYCPIALLAGAGIRALYQRHRDAAMLCAALFIGFFLSYASLGNWMGGRSYGPRYLVPLLPALILPLAFWRTRGWPRAAIALAAFSVVIQVPGVLVDYSKVRMDRARAGETVAQDMRWREAPLWLNARASVANVGRAAADLIAGAPSRTVRASDPDLSTALGFSPDFWWMYLFYLGRIGRGAVLGIVVLLSALAALALRRAFVLSTMSPPSWPG